MFGPAVEGPANLALKQRPPRGGLAPSAEATGGMVRLNAGAFACNCSLQSPVRVRRNPPNSYEVLILDGSDGFYRQSDDCLGLARSAHKLHVERPATRRDKDDGAEVSGLEAMLWKVPRQDYCVEFFVRHRRALG